MKNILLVAVVIALLLAACNPGSTQTSIPSSTTDEPLPTSIVEIAKATITPTLTPTSTEVIFPTFPPPPTLTPLAPLQAGQSITLANIHMMDQQSGWGIDVGQHIIHTMDGGHTWKDVTPNNVAYDDSGFFALDAQTAWATAYQDICLTANCLSAYYTASIWHTTNGGETWQEQPLCLLSADCNFDFDIEPEAYSPVTIQFIDEKRGWLLIVVAHMMFQDRYRIYKTTDGGAHWSPMMDSLTGPMTNQATGLAFQDGQSGWMSTSEIYGASDPTADWSIYQSTDAGITWNSLQLPAPRVLPDTFATHTVWCGADYVEVVPPDSVGVLIDCILYDSTGGPAYDFYFHSANGGKSWKSWPETGNTQFINAQAGWRLTSNNNAYNLEQTRDGGQSWGTIKTVQWKGDLDFISEQVGWAIASNDNAVALVQTSDGGKTWKEIHPQVSK